MTTTGRPTASALTGVGAGSARGPAVDIVVPVHNEQQDLEPSVRRLYDHLATAFPFSFRITIADNASTDDTWASALRLADELPGVRAVHLAEKGRGRALRQVWSHSDAQVLAYMDVDLSTDLAALLPLVAPLLSGHSDIAIGSRLSRSARVVRGPKREIISRGYNLLLHTTLATGFSDAQCGFKAIRADRARQLLPLVQDTHWFFDTELLVLAERSGLRIHEVPVDWVDDPDSRVDIVATALADLRGIVRLGRALGGGQLPLATVGAAEAEAVAGTPPGMVRQLVRFAAIGVASTLAYVLLYLLLRHGLSAQWANALALLATTVGNTAANRRLTFGLRGPGRRARQQLQGLVVLAVGLVLTSGALALLARVDPDPTRSVELAVLVAASVGATLVRFLLFRSWVFRGSGASTAPARPTRAPAAPDPAAPDQRTRHDVDHPRTPHAGAVRARGDRPGPG